MRTKDEHYRQIGVDLISKLEQIEFLIKESMEKVKNTQSDLIPFLDTFKKINEYIDDMNQILRSKNP